MSTEKSLRLVVGFKSGELFAVDTGSSATFQFEVTHRLFFSFFYKHIYFSDFFDFLKSCRRRRGGVRWHVSVGYLVQKIYFWYHSCVVRYTLMICREEHHNRITVYIHYLLSTSTYMSDWHLWRVMTSSGFRWHNFPGKNIIRHIDGIYQSLRLTVNFSRNFASFLSIFNMNFATRNRFSVKFVLIRW